MSSNDHQTITSDMQACLWCYARILVCSIMRACVFACIFERTLHKDCARKCILLVYTTVQDRNTLSFNRIIHTLRYYGRSTTMRHASLGIVLQEGLLLSRYEQSWCDRACIAEQFDKNQSIDEMLLLVLALTPWDHSPIVYAPHLCFIFMLYFCWGRGEVVGESSEFSVCISMNKMGRSRARICGRVKR